MTTVFGGATLYIENITVAQAPHKTKQSIGKRSVAHEIIGADSHDYVLEIKGYISAASSAALQTARNALQDLNDGAKHAYTDSLDSRYDGDYTIETSSLSFEVNLNPQFVRYSMRLIQW